MSKNKNSEDEIPAGQYYPRFLVTQAEYDAASTQERKHSVVDELVLDPPILISDWVGRGLRVH